MLCNFCGQSFTDRGTKIFRPLKFCSELCNKRAWYVRNVKRKRSVFTNNPILGIEWEEWFIKAFGAKRPSRSLNTPADFIFEGKTIDLKVSNLGNGHWTFRRKGKKKVDEYICICLIDGKPLKYLRIPSNEYPKGGMGVGRLTSKYDKFIWRP